MDEASVSTKVPDEPTVEEQKGRQHVPLRLYSRLMPGRKALFAPSDSEPAHYFLKNPTPHRHAAQWRPIFYRGDNPKYTESTMAIGRARRTAMFGTFKVWLGDGIDEVMKNKERVSAKNWYRRRERWRKWFHRKSKPPKKPLEDVKEVEGKIIYFEMFRTSFLGRSVEWELHGERYRWSGTRKFTTGALRRIKGLSHDMKLVRRSDHCLIATFEKGRWSGFNPKIKTGKPPNKAKWLVGQLQFHNHPSSPEFSKGSVNTGSTIDKSVYKTHLLNGKPIKNLNLDGPHSSDLLEDAMVFSCWIVVEAEHRLRYKIFDLLEEAGENAGG
ncbi:hypothetical protein FQN57_006639 [Myotisia sp. PD_48]|nr:hypothetical protein FQN57_006639 [Myotisia sp. PD_48]